MEIIADLTDILDKEFSNLEKMHGVKFKEMQAFRRDVDGKETKVPELLDRIFIRFK